MLEEHYCGSVFSFYYAKIQSRSCYVIVTRLTRCGRFLVAGFWAVLGNAIMLRGKGKGDSGMKRQLVFLFMLLAFLVTGCSRGATEVTSQPETVVKPAGALEINFIDVGQADSILVTTGEVSMLIDAGNNQDGDLVADYLKQQGIKDLDVVMGTHPHEDHVGGLDVVIKNFAIGKVYLPKVGHSTKTYKDVLLALKEKQIKATPATGGQNFQLGKARVELLAPNSQKYDELNNYSIVCKITFGDTRFLLTGDAEELSEQEMLSKGYNLEADLLKVAHHGSRSSTSDAFLGAVSPETVIISVGQENDYGHPHRETLQKLKARGIKVYQTSYSGTIKVVSDGKTIDVQGTKPR